MASAAKSEIKVNTKANLKWVSKKAKVSTPTKMDPPTKEAGIKTRWMDMAHMCGQMGENTMDNGPKTICMGTASTCMLTVRSTTACLNLVRNMDLASMRGKMVQVGSMKVIGKMGFSMDSGYIQAMMEPQ